MKYFLTIFSITALFVITTMSVTASAKQVSSSYTQTCKMVETVTLNINFNNIPIELKEASGFMEQKAEDVTAKAADLGIEKIDIQNMSYNVYSYNNGGCNAGATSQFQLNGSFSFQLKDSKKAITLMESLSDMGYNVNFNMNAYRQCQ